MHEQVSAITAASSSTGTPFGSGPVSALALTSDELHFAAAVDRNYVQVSTVPIPSPTPSAPGPTLPVTPDSILFKLSTPSISALAFPQRSSLYVADSRGALTRYSTQNLDTRNFNDSPAPQPDFTVPAAHSGAELTAVAAASSEAPAVTGGKDGTVRVWDVEQHTALRKLTGHRHEVRALAVSSDNDQTQSQWTGLIASGGRDRTVRLWDARAWEGDSAAVHVFSDHSSWVHGVALAEAADPSPSVVSVSGDKTVRVWDLRTLRLRAAFRGHQYRIWDVAVASRAGFAVSGSTDASVRVWPIDPSTFSFGNTANPPDANTDSDQTDPIDGAELAVLEMHRDSVIAVSAARDGRFVLSACEDGTVLSWRPPISNVRDAVLELEKESNITDTEVRPTETVNNVTEETTNHADQGQASVEEDGKSITEGKLVDIDDDTASPRSPLLTRVTPITLDATPLFPELDKAATRGISSTSETQENRDSDESKVDILRIASSKRIEQAPTFDRSAAELVGALSRVRDLEQSLQAANKQMEQKAMEIATLKVELRRRDTEISRLSKLLDEARRAADAVAVHDALRQDEGKANIPLDYSEPVNKIGAVSDQLTKLVARLDAMIATS